MKQASRLYHWRNILSVFEEELAFVRNDCSRICNGEVPHVIIHKLISDLGIQKVALMYSL